MIDASAFLSVAGARAAYRRAAPPLRDAHVAALAAGFTRRAAPLGCVVQLFAPASAPADADGLLAGVPLAHKDAFDTGRHAPRLGGPRATGTPRPAAAVLRRLAGHGALNLGALAMAEHACGATAENPHAPALMNPLDSAAADRRRANQRLDHEAVLQGFEQGGHGWLLLSPTKTAGCSSSLTMRTCGATSPRPIFFSTLPKARSRLSTV